MAAGKLDPTALGAAVQVIQLDGSEPAAWQGFADRWRQWRERFDRRSWEQSWQGEAWRSGELRFPSPWDGGEVVSQCSLRRGLVFGYVLQQGLQRALLLPGWLGGGHELEALYLLREQVLLLFPCSLAGVDWFLLALAELLPELVTTTPWPAAQDPQRPRRLILEGHPNFAHQLLNVLTAVEACETADLPLCWLGQQPYGPIRSLFPEVTWQPGTDGEAPGASFELPLSQRPDGIPCSLRRRIRRSAAAQLGDGARELLERLMAWRAGGGRVLWVSLKTRGAWADGLPDLVAAWMAALRERGEAPPLLLLDGFSLQHGDGLGTPLYGTTVGELLEEERQQAVAVRQALAEQGLADSVLPVEEAIGCSLAESIALGRAVDGYLCHQGTVQHKLGWFQDDLPGVVHSCSMRNRGGTHPWGGLGGLEPLWLPEAFCEDLGEGPRAAYRFRAERLPEAGQWLAAQALWRTA